MGRNGLNRKRPDGLVPAIPINEAPSFLIEIAGSSPAMARRLDNVIGMHFRRQSIIQNDPNAVPRPMTTPSAMMAPTMPTITMSK
jgi:hypothetical protein